MRSPAKAVLRGLAAPAVLASAWATPAQAQESFPLDIVCPCRVETSNLTSVDVHFGVRNRLEDGDTGPLEAELQGRRRGGEGWWRRLGTVHLPAVAAGATRQPQRHTVALEEQAAGTWELRLRIYGGDRLLRDSIYWLSEPVEMSFGGGSFSSVFFDGTPAVSIAGGNATLDLPAVRNGEGGESRSQLSVALVAASSLELGSRTRALATHAYNSGLQPGGKIAAAKVTLAVDSSESHEYLQLQIRDGDGEVLAYETVQVPQDESLPVLSIATSDADMLLDTDKDGVSDVNERLMGTDPAAASSKPGDSTVDILALYSPGFRDLYGGEPSTRIRHVITLAEAIFADSEVDLNLRLVGIAEAQVDESQGFARLNEVTLKGLTEQHGADIAILFRPYAEQFSVCGWAFLPGHRTGGTGLYDYASATRQIHVFGDCGGDVTAHELGHAMGLGHSYAQDEVGTFRWSRGHGEYQQFVTIMAYGSAYDYPPDIDVFSSPDADCNGRPCGVATSKPDGADAVTTLNATRFQVARWAKSKPDSDGDGFVDPVDAFPRDASEQFDFDGDGTGDNADADDDNDGVADISDPFPFDATEWSDSDGDGVGDNTDLFPLDRLEFADADGDGVGDNGDLFPQDPTETVDTDNDGVGNNADAFPFDTREWLDTDGDGIGDNADDDADGDGVADIADHFPQDAARHTVSSYRFIVSDGAGRKQRFAPAGDIDGDGRGDFLIGLSHYDYEERTQTSVAYLVAAADLPAADAADGVTDRSINLASVMDQPGSWKFVGEESRDRAGESVGSAGDIDGDGRNEVIIGAPSYDSPGGLWNAGAVYIISPPGLPAADAADGEADGVVHLGNIAAREDSWKIIGAQRDASAGESAGLAGDLDGDGSDELFVGVPFPGHEDHHGAVHIFSPAQLSAADEADGAADGVVSLGQLAALPGSWKLGGEDTYSQVGRIAAAPAEDAAGNAALLVTSEGYKGGGESALGAVYLVSSADLSPIDAADGESDRVLELGRVAAADHSWQFVGKPDREMRGAAGLGDIDADGSADFFLESEGSAFLASGADLPDLDRADGDADGVIRPHGQKAPNSWEAADHWPQGSPAQAANLDGDGIADLAVLNRGGGWLLAGTDLAAARGKGELQFAGIPSSARSWRAAAKSGYRHGLEEVGLAGDTDGDGIGDALIFTDNNEVFLLASADLRVLDNADSSANGRIGLGQLVGDADADGIENVVDHDDDGDGRLDSDDVFPQDGADWFDSDGDGVGDNTDEFPRDRNEQVDTDGDGIGDRADADDDGDGVDDADDPFPLDTDDDGTANALDEDDDGDGVADSEDRFPLDSAESADTDGDGVGDNADTDDDGDGTLDTVDAFPRDAAESADADGDGVGDNSDAFPGEATESADTDGDGVGDNADTDDDGDGTPDKSDAFPRDAAESADADGDGVGDNGDAFPDDASESADTDGDGVGDNADADDDGDGYTDGADAFPLDSGRARLFHYRFAANRERAQAGHAVSAGDVDGDGRADALIGAPGTWWWGAAYAASSAEFDAADVADGPADGRLELDDLVTQPNSGAAIRREAGRSVAFVGDRGGSGMAEWLVGAPSAEDDRGAAYLITLADQAAADAVNGLDGIARLSDLPKQPGSWAFVGEEESDEAGRRVASAGDVNSDGYADFLIGAPGAGKGDRGAAYLVSGTGFADVDEADDSADGLIELSRAAALEGSWKFLGEADGGEAGNLVASAGDTDGDGMADVMIGAPYHSQNGLSSRGAAYLIAAADLKAADQSDGKTDGIIELKNISARSASWKFLGESAGDSAGWSATTADTDGDGNLELMIGAPGHFGSAGAVYLLPLSSLPQADAADGSSDGVVDLGKVAALGNAYKLLGDPVHYRFWDSGSRAGSALGVLDGPGDGRARLVVGAEDYVDGGVWCRAPDEPGQSGAVYLVSGKDLVRADAADGGVDGVIRLANVVAQPDSLQILGEAMDRLGSSIATGGDLDGDGQNDLILGAPDQFQPGPDCRARVAAGVVIVLGGADIAVADRRDGNPDSVVNLEALRQANRMADFDFDGTENELDSDDDNDGVADAADAFPLDPAESADNDFDGMGDNADADDDNDGTPDRLDAFPFDPHETTDTDEDGIGDNADRDDDNDGTADVDDAFPLDASETADSDGDGIGDNADSDPDDATVDTDGDGIADAADSDDDGDGVADADDLYPLDNARSDLYFYRVAGSAIALSGTDFDGDGQEDLVAETALGDTWLLSSGDLDSADGADGSEDRRVDLDRDSVPAGSWKLGGASVGSVFAAGDLDSDGKDDLIVDGLLVSASSLPAEDNAHGAAGDRQLQLSANSAGRNPGIWRLIGSQREWAVFSLADLNGDGHGDLLVGSPDRQYGSGETVGAYVVSGAELPLADVRDGAEDGDIDLDQLVSRDGWWKIASETYVEMGASISAAGDINGDGHLDLMIGAPRMWLGANTYSGAVVVISGAALKLLDEEDKAGGWRHYAHAARATRDLESVRRGRPVERQRGFRARRRRWRRPGRYSDPGAILEFPPHRRHPPGRRQRRRSRRLRLEELRRDSQGESAWATWMPTGWRTFCSWARSTHTWFPGAICRSLAIPMGKFVLTNRKYPRTPGSLRFSTATSNSRRRHRLPI